MPNDASSAPHAGTVIGTRDGEATLRFSRGKMCAHCGACLSAGPQEMEMTLPNTLDAKIGDTVSVEMAEGKVAGVSLIAYLIPLALILIGVWIGSRFSDVAGLCCGIGGWTVSFAILRLIDSRLKKRSSFRPRMREIMTENFTEEIEN